ncbi:MAG: MFS transporter [Candidatus Hermodarchaeia archaeon]
MSAIFRAEATGYWQRIRQFTPNVRKLILSNVTRAFAWGITSTILNIYLLTLGYSNAFLGVLMSLNAFSMAIFSLAAGTYAARVGPKYAIIVGLLTSTIVGYTRVVFPFPSILMITAVLAGLGAALINVSFGPLMTRSCTAYERTHAFGTSHSLTILSSFISNTIAGFLPSLIALSLGLPFDSAIALQLALLAHVIPLALSIIPMFTIHELEVPTPDPMNEIQSELTPVKQKAVRKLALKFGIVNLLIGLGAGFVIPYLSIFFWEFYTLPLPVIGLVQGLGSLSVAIGTFLSPVLSTRIGKVKTVLFSQALSLPFLLFIATIINPYIAIASYILRVVLMNAGGPVDRTLRMELTPEHWRPNMEAVTSFGWNFPWAFSTLVTGPLFDLELYLVPFWFTLTSYSAATVLYAAFFWNIEKRQRKSTTKTNKTSEVRNS